MAPERKANQPTLIFATVAVVAFAAYTAYSQGHQDGFAAGKRKAGPRSPLTDLHPPPRVGLEYAYLRTEIDRMIDQVTQVQGEREHFRSQVLEARGEVDTSIAWQWSPNTIDGHYWRPLTDATKGTTPPVHVGDFEGQIIRVEMASLKPRTSIPIASR